MIWKSASSEWAICHRQTKRYVEIHTAHTCIVELHVGITSLCSALSCTQVTSSLEKKQKSTCLRFPEKHNKKKGSCFNKSVVYLPGTSSCHGCFCWGQQQAQQLGHNEAFRHLFSLRVAPAPACFHQMFHVFPPKGSAAKMGTTASKAGTS